MATPRTQNNDTQATPNVSQDWRGAADVFDDWRLSNGGMGSATLYQHMDHARNQQAYADTATSVARAHPDWSASSIRAEASRIMNTMRSTAETQTDLDF